MAKAFIADMRKARAGDPDLSSSYTLPVESASLDGIEERLAVRAGDGQDWGVCELGVSYAERVREACNLNALPVRVAVAGLAKIDFTEHGLAVDHVRLLNAMD
jgi:hypothetical protein